MPTVLDELVIRLGLDSRAFQTQVQQTRTGLSQVGAVARRESSKLEEELKKVHVETGRRMQQVEQVGRQVGQQLSSVKGNVLGLLGAVAGAYGLQQFVSNLIGADAALGNFSKALDLNTEDVATWIEMGKSAGTSTDSMKTALASLSQIKQDYLTKGNSPTTGVWNFLGINPQSKNEFELMKEIADWVQKHPPSMARARLQEIGISPDMIPLLMKGRAELEKLEAQKRSLGVATAKSAEEDQKFLNSLAEIRQAVQNLGREILSEFHEPLLKALGAMRDWVVANRDWLKTEIGSGISAAIPAIKEFAAAAEKVVEFLGGWKTTMEVILGIWIGSKVAHILGFVVDLAKLLGGAATAVTTLGISMEKLALVTAPAWLTGLLRFLPMLSTLGFLSGDTPGGGAQQTPEEREEFIKKFHEQNPGVPLETFREFYNRTMPSWLGGSGGGGGAGGASDERKASIRDKLAGDPRLGISREAASGIVSNLNAESGIRGINEMNNGPGFGWTQWTDTQGSPRRTTFMNFAKALNLDPASDEANYQFLVEELKTKYPGVLAQLQRGNISATEAANIVARGYVVPPADKIPGHVADAENVAKLPSTIPKVGPTFGQQMQVGPQVLPPPAAAATVGPQSFDNSRVNSIDTHISGPITIHTAATDAEGIAKGIGGALQRYNYVPQMNTGLA